MTITVLWLVVLRMICPQTEQGHIHSRHAGTPWLELLPSMYDFVAEM